MMNQPSTAILPAASSVPQPDVSSLQTSAGLLTTR